MRSLVVTMAVALELLFAGGVAAAPTCQDGLGDTIKCGVPGAKPVGWTLPDAQRWDRDFVQASTLDTMDAIRLACLIGAIFGLLALLPEFDGWRDGDWDRQEGDDEI